jgi:diaminohydroxyphosphoribosylaminopyrimidine deaminase/5-amino-6-(5-phosphoribosylamino)uracil reductase
VSDAAFMAAALAEARKGEGRTHPNPVVGAVVVKSGRVVGRGFHEKAGAPHAEVMALRMAGRRAKGATLYSSLEPCNHHGRTPPCVDAVLAAGIRRVVVASFDPNPLVSGKGLRRLRRAGVEVVTRVLQAEADALNGPFFKFMRTGLPWVTLKAAVTADGKLATANGDSKWVTGAQAREQVHHLRDRVDAVLVGAGTVEADDPQLTARIPGGRNPLRVVLDSALRLSPGRRVFAPDALTVVATAVREGSARAKRLHAEGVDTWHLPAGEGGVALEPLLRRLAAAGQLHLLVEGGAEVYTSILRAGLVDEVQLYVAPRLLGAPGMGWVGELGVGRMADALQFRIAGLEQVGEDARVTLRPTVPFAARGEGR